MHGLKNVRTRRTDALTQVGWEQLESLLAAYYRGQGYTVDHCGTGASGARFDGGIDLKLHKDDAYIVVQCKHWNAKQVPHNDVHQLIGVMVNESATGAILVTSGEFTRAAIEAANKHGHVQLVDGDDLRTMLSPLPETPRDAAEGSRSLIAGAAHSIGGRLLGAAEDRIRHRGAPPRQRRPGAFATTMGAGLWLLVLKLLFGLVIVLILGNTIQSVIGALPAGSGRASRTQPVQPSPLPVPQDVGAEGVMQGMGTQPARRAEVIDHSTGMTIEDRPRGMPAYDPPTAEEMRESQRRADEAARIIEANTPEM